MRKTLSIALSLSIAALAAPAAHAEPSAIDRLVAQERAQGVGLEPEAETLGQRIAAQERGRQADARLFGPSNSAPVQIIGPADGFDVGDAGIGGAAALALALLAAAAVAARGNRRHGSAGAASAGN